MYLSSSNWKWWKAGPHNADEGPLPKNARQAHYFLSCFLLCERTLKRTLQMLFRIRPFLFFSVRLLLFGELNIPSTIKIQINLVHLRIFFLYFIEPFSYVFNTFARTYACANTLTKKVSRLSWVVLRYNQKTIIGKFVTVIRLFLKTEQIAAF